jgi:hypothetical protein
MAVRSLAQSSLVEPSSTNSMLAGYSGNDFHHLETVRLSSSAASVTFSNLARYSDFQHLQIRAVARSNRSGTGGLAVNITLNGVTTGYQTHLLYGRGSSVLSAAYAGRGIERMTNAGSEANAFGAFVTDILDPFETTKNTTIRSLGGYSATDPIISLTSTGWFNTASVTSIQLSDPDASFIAGSRFSLYGLKARA